MDPDELATYEPTEEELALVYMSSMADTLLEQIRWLKEVIEAELDREVDDRREMEEGTLLPVEEEIGRDPRPANNLAPEIPDGFIPLKEAASHYYIIPGMIRQLALEHHAIPFFWNGERVLVRVTDLVRFFEYLFSDILPELDQHIYFYEDSMDDDLWQSRMESFPDYQAKDD